LALVPLAALLLAWTGAAGAAPIWDLTTDWSDATNPSGPWAYRHGAELLPHVDSWEGGTGYFAEPQPAWARHDLNSTRIPCLFRSSANVVTDHDFTFGDVVCHTRDDANGVGSGEANVAWVSPVEGTINVEGAVWMGRDIGRSNHWSLWLNATKLTEGDIASGDPYSRAAPFDLSAGSGGPPALTNLAVHVGDALALKLERTSQYGDFVGIRLRVTLLSNTGLPLGGETRDVSLAAPRPNPAAGGVATTITLAREAQVTLTVLDVTGRVRGVLANGRLPAGEHAVAWREPVADGMYFLRLRADGREVTRRVVVLH
jgi:hypothetical protein